MFDILIEIQLKITSDDAAGDDDEEEGAIDECWDVNRIMKQYHISVVMHLLQIWPEFCTGDLDLTVIGVINTLNTPDVSKQSARMVKCRERIKRADFFLKLAFPFYHKKLLEYENVPLSVHLENLTSVLIQKITTDNEEEVFELCKLIVIACRFLDWSFTYFLYFSIV